MKPKKNNNFYLLYINIKFKYINLIILYYNKNNINFTNFHLKFYYYY